VLGWDRGIARSTKKELGFPSYLSDEEYVVLAGDPENEDICGHIQWRHWKGVDCGRWWRGV
jgi:hypothetical protein